VHEEDTFAALLPERLARQTGSVRHEVLNCGMEAMTVRRLPARLAAISRHFEPDLVVLAINPDDPDARVRAARPDGVHRLRELLLVGNAIAKLWSAPLADRPQPTAAALRRLEADASRIGAHLTVVVFGLVGARSGVSFGHAVLGAFEDRDVLVVDARPILQQSHGWEELVVDPDYDWAANEIAHSIVADALAAALAARSWVGALAEDRGAP
jgi:hypothetical protein